MKYLEIILKVGFLADAIYLFITKNVYCVNVFLGISFILGIVLIFNKKQSYGYELSKREIVIRRIEGVILIVFSIVTFYLNA